MLLESLHSAYRLAKVESYPLAASLSQGATPQPQSSSQDAIVDEISGSYFQQKLEKHLTDYRSGQGHLSERTYDEIVKKERETSALLSQINPDASLLYAGYRTANFSYSNEARFVSYLKNATEETNKILNAGKNTSNAVA